MFVDQKYRNIFIITGYNSEYNNFHIERQEGPITYHYTYSADFILDDNITLFLNSYGSSLWNAMNG